MLSIRISHVYLWALCICSASATVCQNTAKDAPDCTVAYDQVQGSFINVPAYSNGNDSYVSEDGNIFHGLYTGMKWQCVEFARRWLLLRKGVIFGSVDTAADMYTQVQCVKRIADGKFYPVKAFPNGSPSPPPVGALLIYSVAEPDYPVGHVNVITEVSTSSPSSMYVRVGEQNWSFGKWKGNYNRQIPLKLTNKNYWISDVDDNIKGWLVVQENELQPMQDLTTIDKSCVHEEDCLDLPYADEMCTGHCSKGQCNLPDSKTQFLSNFRNEYVKY